MNWWKKMVVFFSEVRTEIKKSSFPSREEVIGTTGVVIITCIVFAIFLWLSDLLIIKGYQGLINALGAS
jgi:preprotein translocase subunit SecE